MQRLYGGMERGDIDPEMYRAVAKVIKEGAVEGITRAKVQPTREEEFYRALRHSSEVFSAFKVHSMAESMRAKLFDDKGKLKPFLQWKQEVAPIASHHMGSWLQTEYNTAVLRAHNAADWRVFEANKDVMPNLRWMPTTSPHAEASHMAYWERKLTLPVDDPFWNKHHPGDRWNCKCSLEATDEQATPELLEKLEKPQPQRGLENNPGKDGALFSDNHPYFPKDCAHCAFYKPGITDKVRYIFMGRKKDCYNCPYINGCIPGSTNMKYRVNQKIRTIKSGIHPYNGVVIENDAFCTGKIRLLRRSLQDIYEHSIEDPNVLQWLAEFDMSKLKDWKYEGWAENRPYSMNHPKYDPKHPDKKKHPETDFFLYYTLKINNTTYWANVKMHKLFKGEVLYTIEKNKPAYMVKGKKER